MTELDEKRCRLGATDHRKNGKFTAVRANRGKSAEKFAIFAHICIANAIKKMFDLENEGNGNGLRNSYCSIANIKINKSQSTHHCTLRLYLHVQGQPFDLERVSKVAEYTIGNDANRWRISTSMKVLVRIYLLPFTIS